MAHAYQAFLGGWLFILTQPGVGDIIPAFAITSSRTSLDSHLLRGNVGGTPRVGATWWKT